ncbi:hypothetical protein JZO81_21965 [Enterococcus hulanensis]|uniref:hypothetical protein n=1 Tax=Enterococcus hulanensis TaxID=2559929 RepID=UPI001A9272FB|nr:hypothetical protein [Enterococcus hulanensis]MBO0413713.1 hypothetical protein [Enterococcus hulanensis]
MKKNKLNFFLVSFSICLLIILLVYIFFRESPNRNDYVTEIEIGKVYKMDTYKGEKISSPSYIKFLDKKKYVALPDFSTEEDYGQGLSFIFVEGTYEKNKPNEYSLGSSLRDVRISFDNYQDYKDKILSFKPGYGPTDEIRANFEEGKIFLKDGKYYYKQTIRTGDSPPKIYENDEPLKISTKKIPNSIEEFLSQYSQKVESSDASKNN